MAPNPAQVEFLVWLSLMYMVQPKKDLIWCILGPGMCMVLHTITVHLLRGLTAISVAVLWFAKLTVEQRFPCGSRHRMLLFLEEQDFVTNVYFPLHSLLH